MALPRQFFAPSFRHRHLGRYFALLVGIMVYFATLAMAAEATLSAETFTWDRSLTGRLTVEIPAAGDESSVPQTDRIKQAISILRAIPGITNVTPIDDSETARLLKPWIDQPELLKSLPVPSLIDVDRAADSHVTADLIKDDLKASIHDVRVDDHAAWLANFTHLIEGLAATGGILVLLTAAALIIAVSLLCRAIMAGERETISLLHIMGADDHDIARHFEFHARRLSWPSAAAGFLLALISIGSLLFFLQHFVNAPTLQLLHWAALCLTVLLVPLAAIWIASLSARLSVLNFLYAMP